MLRDLFLSKPTEFLTPLEEDTDLINSLFLAVLWEALFSK